MNTKTIRHLKIAAKLPCIQISESRAICGLFILLASCASVPEQEKMDAAYPGDWARPQVSETKNCVPLTGTYRYVGAPAYDDQNLTKPRFDALVFRRWPNRGQVDSVNLTHKLSQDILEAHLIGQGLSPETQISYSHPAKCIDGWLT